MTVAVEDMRAMSDEELLGLYAAGEEAALTVAAERDQATANAARIAPARQALDAIREEWHEAALAHYAAARASMTCKGTMFSPEGFANGPADEFSLWTVRDSDARRWASRELREWWGLHGRLTVGKYAKQRADAIRAAREDTATGEAGSDDRERVDRETAVGRDWAGNVRHEHSAGTGEPVRTDRKPREAEAGPATGPVRPAGRQRIGGEAMDTAPIVAGANDANQRQTVTGQVVRRPVSQAARPPAKPIDGAMLADLTDGWVRQRCYLTDSARHAIVLWTMAQHFRTPDEKRVMIWEKFPHLLFIAETPGSGKTTAMKIGGFMCAPYYFGIANNPTAPGLCMTIAHEKSVVCIDEAHRIIGPKGTRKADVVTIMCASFEQDGTYLNARGGKANRIPVYAPMMIAAKKDPFLTSAVDEISDVIERSHLILMSKPPEGTELTPVDGQTKEDGKKLATVMAQWAAQQMADKAAFSEATDNARAAAAEIGLEGRDADVWLAQFTVAALCGGGFLQAACDAALELRRNQPAPKEEESADPLADLAASLAGDGELSSWG